MIVPSPEVKGGIAAVCSRYYDSPLTEDYDLTFLESYRDGTKFQKLVKALGCYRAFRRLLREDPPDLLHVQSSFGPSFFRKLPLIRMAKKRGIPVIDQLHGSDLEGLFYRQNDRRKALVREVYTSCDRLVVLSEHWKEALLRIAPEAKIEVLPNYAEKTTIPDTGADDLREAKKQVLFLGMLTQAKGIDDFPEVVRRVLEAVPDASFVFAGEGDVDAVTAKLSEKERARTAFPGWIRGKEKEQLLRESAVLFFPSRMEAFPMAVLEAMAHALPVVSCAVGGIPELVAKEQNGYLFAPGDTKAMADAIICLLTQRDKRESMGRNAYRLAQEKFSSGAHVRKLEEIYEEVLRHG